MVWTAKTAGFGSLSVKERFEALPQHLRKTIERAKDSGLIVTRVWLFGSRGRMTSTEVGEAGGGSEVRSNSDFDLAFELNDAKSWASFRTQMIENPPSVYQVDLINLNECQGAIRDKIVSEGIVIYESTASQ